MHKDKPPGYPLSFRIRPPDSTTDGLKSRSGISMTLALSVIGILLCTGLMAAVLWARDGGGPPSVSSNAVEAEIKSALPRSAATLPADRATATQAAPPSSNTQPAVRASVTLARSAGGKPAVGATETKTAPAPKATPTATRSRTLIPTRGPTLTPQPTAPPTAARPGSPTATRIPPTAYPTGAPVPPPPGTCILGCD